MSISSAFRGDDDNEAAFFVILLVTALPLLCGSGLPLQIRMRIRTGAARTCPVGT
jgi:hypothetical protein